MKKDRKIRRELLDGRKLHVLQPLKLRLRILLGGGKQRIDIGAVRGRQSQRQ